MNITKIKTVGLFFITLIIVTSCNSKDEIIENVSTNEAKEIIESSLQKSTAGFEVEIEESAQESVENYSINLTCNEEITHSFDRVYSGTVVNANYNVNCNYQLLCNNFNLPESLIFTSESSGFYETQRITSVDNTTSNLIIEGLEPLEGNLLFTGNYKREGTQQLHVLQEHNVSSSLFLEFIEIIVSKTTYLIISGNALVVLTGTTTNGQEFTFNGNIVFNGNKMATLTINGETYEIDLN